MEIKNLLPKKTNKRKRLKWRGKITLSLGTIFLFLILFTTVLYYTAQFFDTYQMKFQPPVMFQKPILIQKRKTIIISPIAKNKSLSIKAYMQMVNWQVMPDNIDKEKWNYVIQQPMAKMLVYIWQHESNYGRDNHPDSLNNYCRTIGKYNEFGWMGMKGMKCFDTFELSVQQVVKTLESYSNINDEMKLCYYNVGIKENDCNYLADWSSN